MNLGEFIIKIGTQADTKQLEKATKAVENAEKKTKRLIQYLKDLKNATTENEKALVKKNFAQKIEAERLKDATTEQNALSDSINKSITTSLKFIGAIGATVTMLDRLGNSLLKSNQLYITFEKQTDISISKLNKMAGLARLGGMNLGAEQVAGDIASLQEKIFEFERLGKNAETFGMLGINPRGMKSDQLITALRTALKGRSGLEKSYYLQQLGLSQEWLNVLDLTDDKYREYLKTSKELQLSEKERKQLAQYTALQQKNNMRWELARQKLLLAVMPMVQKIMEVTSKIALKISNIFEKNPQWLSLARDVLLILASGTILKTITAITKLLGMGGGLAKAFAPLLALFGAKGIGGTISKSMAGISGTMGALGRVASKKGLRTALGMAGKRLLTAGAGWLGGPVLGTLFTIASTVLILKDIYDIVADWFGKEKQKDEELEPDPDISGTRYQYQNVRSNMTNNFYNNPQPAKEAIEQLSGVKDLLLAEQYR